MSAEEQKQGKATALLEYTKMRERRMLLKNETEKLAEAFEELAKRLRNHPERLKSGGTGELMENYRRLGALVDDVKATAGELQRLDSVLRNAGLSHALDKN
jgi:hypothetical protein